jgi:hypothetical protein
MFFQVQPILVLLQEVKVQDHLLLQAKVLLHKVLHLKALLQVAHLALLMDHHQMDIQQDNNTVRVQLQIQILKVLPIMVSHPQPETHLQMAT